MRHNGRQATVLPRNRREDDEFWDHIDIATGMKWSKDAESGHFEDACAVFWGMKVN